MHFKRSTNSICVIGILLERKVHLQMTPNWAQLFNKYFSFIFFIGSGNKSHLWEPLQFEEVPKGLYRWSHEYFGWSVLFPELSPSSSAVFWAHILFFSFLPVSPQLQQWYCFFFQLIPPRKFQFSRVHISYRFENNPNHVGLRLHYFYFRSLSWVHTISAVLFSVWAGKTSKAGAKMSNPDRLRN